MSLSEKDVDKIVLNSLKRMIVFLFGGTGYCLIELLWRGHTHWSMYLTGGLCFYVIERLNRTILVGKALWSKCAAGAVVITGIEFSVGCVVNLWLGLGVWDYTRLPMNLLGQISLMYSSLWYILSAPISMVSKVVAKRFRIES